MKLVDHISQFDAQTIGGSVGVGATISTIGFGTYHKFKNAEEVIYLSYNQDGISGLTTNASYWVNVRSNTVVTLHNSEIEAQVGLSTVQLLSYGVGTQALK